MIAPRSFLPQLFQAVYSKVHMILCYDLIFYLRLSEVHINFVGKQKSNFDHSSSFLRSSCSNSTSLSLVIPQLSFASSATNYNVDLNVFGIEFIYISSKRGPSTDTWGIRLRSSFQSDLLSFINRSLVSSQGLLKLFVKILVKKSPNSNTVFG